MAYPDTDQQYALQAADQPALSSAGVDSISAPVDTISTATVTSGGDWEEFVDDESGATYFFNAKTGESSWGAPPAAASSVARTSGSSAHVATSSKESYEVVNGEYVYNAWAGASTSSK